MNNKLPYEQLITEKLQALPIPDMADAIWARIEAQLDTDMPTSDDDGGASPAPQGPSVPKIIGGFGLSVVLVALLTIFYNRSDNNISNSPVTPNSTDLQQSTPTPAQQSPVVSPMRTGSSSPPSNRQQPPGDSSSIYPAVQDSALALPIPPAPILTQDSALKATPPLVTPPVANQVPAVKDTITRKPRGVQGIGDDDYRIVPKKKDSL